MYMASPVAQTETGASNSHLKSESRAKSLTLAMNPPMTMNTLFSQCEARQRHPDLREGGAHEEQILRQQGWSQGNEVNPASGG